MNRCSKCGCVWADDSRVCPGCQKPSQQVNAKEADKLYRISEDGKTITLGSYPQSRVTNSELLEQLNKLVQSPQQGDTTWTSYNYYIDNEAEGYMLYKDVEHQGARYRAVYMEKLRPYRTSHSSKEERSFQDENGYKVGEFYWFKWEPVNWRVLKRNNNSVVIIADVILDSQAYNCDLTEHRLTSESQKKDVTITVYANNNAYSDIRYWLNKVFFETAFQDCKNYVTSTTVFNIARCMEKINDKTATNDKRMADKLEEGIFREKTDKVYLLGFNDLVDASMGFDVDYGATDVAKQRKTTDYAQCQGAFTEKRGECVGNGYWWMLAPFNCDGEDNIVYVIDTMGRLSYTKDIDATYFGVVPVLTVNL